MNKWSVRFLVCYKDCKRADTFTVKSYGMEDAMSRFHMWRDLNHPFDNVEMIAVWKSSEGDFVHKKRMERRK